MAEAGPWREEFKARVRRCEYCLKSREPEMLCCHEIARGGLRRKALMAPYAILVLCREPNWRTGEDCHKIVGEWPQARQLALLYLTRSGDYSLAAFNELVNPNAPLRITQDEVDVHIKDIFASLAQKRIDA